jgi:hypothetical protein
VGYGYGTKKKSVSSSVLDPRRFETDPVLALFFSGFQDANRK